MNNDHSPLDVSDVLAVAAASWSVYLALRAALGAPAACPVDVSEVLAGAVALWRVYTSLRAALGARATRRLDAPPAARPMDVPTPAQMQQILRQAPPDTRAELLTDYWVRAQAANEEPPSKSPAM